MVKAALAAFEEAGVSPNDIAVHEMHNYFWPMSSSPSMALGSVNLGRRTRWCGAATLPMVVAVSSTHPVASFRRGILWARQALAQFAELV